MNRRAGILLSYIYTALNTVIGLVMSAFIIQSVGQTDYGIYQAITAFASYLALFEMGTGTIINRNISMCKKDGTEDDALQKNISTLWTITMVLSGVIGLVSLGFYFSIDWIYKASMTPAQIAFGKPLFILTVVKLIASFFHQTLNGTLIGFEHYAASKVISISHLLLRTALVFVLLLVKRNIYVVVVTDAVLSILTVLVTLLYCRKKHPFKFSLRFFDKAIFLNAMPLAVALLLQTVINMANNSVDKFVISIAMTPDHVAIYAVAMYIYTTFSTIMTIPITMYMPQVAQNMRSGKQEMELTKTMVQPSRLAVVVGGLVLFGFIAVGRPFIRLMYGADYIEAWVIAVVIMIPTLVQMTNGVMANVLDVLNKRHIRSMILMGTTMVNILLTVWWVNVWGMTGAAVATALSLTAGQIIIMNTYYAKKLKIKVLYLFAQSYKGTIPCLLIACAAGWGVTKLFENDWIKLLIGGMSFVLVFLASFVLFGANKAEKTMIFKKFRKKQAQ